MSETLDMEVKDWMRLPLGIIHRIISSVNEIMPDLADLFPFLHGGPECWVHSGGDWVAIRLADRRGPGLMAAIGDFPSEKLELLRMKVEPFTPRTSIELRELLGDQWLSPSCFTYVGLSSNGFISSQDLDSHVFSWLNEIVLPVVMEKNQSRVLRAIPKPPSFDIQAVASSLWVLEGISDEVHDGKIEAVCRQGTAFALRDIGLITCHHVLLGNTVAFQATDPDRKYPVKILAQHDGHDVAILRNERPDAQGLVAGTADALDLMDHVLVAGFPNYRIMDTPRFSPGLVVGFRTVLGVRRLLTNAPIIAGSSGGPIIDRNNRVVGIAVTGADRMEVSAETENHGGIPIDILSFLKNS